jgi:hypothetical protein
MYRFYRMSTCRELIEESLLGTRLEVRSQVVNTNFEKSLASQNPRKMIGSNFGEYPECFAKDYLIRCRVIRWLAKYHLVQELGALEDRANENTRSRICVMINGCWPIRKPQSPHETPPRDGGATKTRQPREHYISRSQWHRGRLVNWPMGEDGWTAHP